MNRYDSYITEYLTANKEVAFDRIGSLRLTTDYPDPNSRATSLSFVYDRKVATSPGLIDFITERLGKSRSLIESDLESHFSQVREFLNIGKPYDVLSAGVIKSNIRGEYEFIPYSETVRAHKIHSQPSKTSGGRKRGSGLQVFTLLIVLAIVGGLGWQLYQFYIKPKSVPVENSETNSGTDSAATNSNADSLAAAPVTYGPDDTVDVHYIFENTDLRLRAKTRTGQLAGFGNEAGYDSSVAGNRKLYSLFISKRTKIADTLAVKDSLEKFLQRSIQIQIVPKQ